MEIQSGWSTFSKDWKIYDLLRFLPPGLMLDIGAAAGDTVCSILANSPESEILAFEPFAGNHKFFHETIGNDPRVTLFPHAVDARSGIRWFQQGKTVEGTEPGWEHMRGYSSLGYLVKDFSPGCARVQTVTVDEIVESRNLRFMKVDAQGGGAGNCEGCI